MSKSKKNQDFLYAEQEDSDLPLKVYKKREFYYNRVPQRPKMESYEDIQKYRESVCKIDKNDFQPREQQTILPNFINPDSPYKGVILMHGTGSGKCHKINTPIRMFDNTIKLVQDIVIGDIVMGDNGFARNVLSLGRGIDQLYEIIPEKNKATSYAVNSEHILCLVDKNNNHIEISVKDYLNLPNKNEYRGYRAIIKDVMYGFRWRMLHEIIRNSTRYIDDDIYEYSNTNEFTDYEDSLLAVSNIVFACGLYFNKKKNTIHGYNTVSTKDNYIYYNFTIKKDNIENYYGFTVDKNNKYLLEDYTVTHNSCTAIAIAEQFKEQIMKYNTKIYVLVPGPVTRENFKKELLTCTGDTYLHNREQFAQMTKEEIDIEKRGAVNSALQYYKILSYKTFYKKVLGEKIQEKKIVGEKKLKTSYRKTEEGDYEREIVVNRITNMNNSILIIDEAHNMTDNEYGDALKKIIKVSENLRVVLLTATPMINLPDEIVSLLNFIRPLDDQIQRDKIFSGEKNYNMKLKPNGLEYLEEKARGYISFYRGNIPYTFAKRVEKGVIPKGLLFTPVVKCFMENFQYDGYIETTKKFEDTLDRGSLASANFVFPVLDENNKDIIPSSSIEGVNILISQINEQKDTLVNLINKKLYNGKLSKDMTDTFLSVTNKKGITGSILKMPYIKQFSIKFYKILNRLQKNVVDKKGPVTAFIYSNLVKAGGIELFAETLLQNGYLEYDIDKQYDIKETTRDYKTGLTLADFKKNNLNRNEFKPATFLLVTGGNEGEEEVPEIKQKIIRDTFNSPDNIDGKHIKFILGSRVMNEGVTLENCSQVHILDVFYNIPKAEQVIGRAIRMCVHQSSINDTNRFPKVYVYRYVVALNNKDTNDLSTDEILYQKAEIKYLTIKQIERLLKEVAFDCPLLLHANMFPEELEKYKDCEPYSPNMKNPNNMCPALCDFRRCDLKCKSSHLNDEYWDSKNKNYRDIEQKDIDYSTFNDNLKQYEIILIKNKIKDLYRFKYVYLYNEILEQIKKSFLKHQSELFNPYFLDQALEDLMPKTENDFNNFKDTLYDKFNRPGYLIQKNKYYIFQLFNENENLPTYYRDNIDIDVENHVSIDNYVQTKYPEAKQETKTKAIENKDYDFESVLEYYNEREEYKYIGIIDKNKNKLAYQVQDLFKIRPKQSKTGSKKRGTGIHSFKGAVCSTAKSKPELINILSKLPSITKKEIDDVKKLSRENVCDFIREKLIYLEKYAVSSDNNKVTYMMIPYNHPSYPFPLNLEDRIKYTITNLNKLVGRSVDVIVKKHKNKDNNLYYELLFSNDKFTTPYNNDIIKLGFNIDKNNWKYIID